MKNLLIAFCCVAFAGTTFAANPATTANNQRTNENSIVSKISPLQIGDNDKDKDRDKKPGGVI